MTPTDGLKSLPRPLRRAVNMLRRFPLSSAFLGGGPVEEGIKLLYSGNITPNDVVVEVGGRMGDGTRVLASLARHVYSFEPSKSNFMVLKTLTWTHHNVDAYNFALSDHPGIANLYRDRSFSGVSSLKRLNDVNYVSQETVILGTLDGLNFRFLPTILVLDCEGSEHEVLVGARKLIPHLRSVLVETHVLGDESSTLGSISDELGRFFPKVTLERVGNELWVVATR